MRVNVGYFEGNGLGINLRHSLFFGRRVVPLTHLSSRLNWARSVRTEMSDVAVMRQQISSAVRFVSVSSDYVWYSVLRKRRI